MRITRDGSRATVDTRYSEIQRMVDPLLVGRPVHLFDCQEAFVPRADSSAGFGIHGPYQAVLPGGLVAQLVRARP